MRQALQFGGLWAAIAAAALIWPLLASLLARDVTATLVVYSIAIALDAVLFVIWVRAALRYSRRAARGETFALKR